MEEEERRRRKRREEEGREGGKKGEKEKKEREKKGGEGERKTYKSFNLHTWTFKQFSNTYIYIKGTNRSCCGVLYQQSGYQFIYLLIYWLFPSFLYLSLPPFLASFFLLPFFFPSCRVLLMVDIQSIWWFMIPWILLVEQLMQQSNVLSMINVWASLALPILNIRS